MDQQTTFELNNVTAHSENHNGISSYDVTLDLKEIGQKGENDKQDPEINPTEKTDLQTEVVISLSAEKYLMYGVKESPPIHITIISAIQQGLLSLSGQLIVSLLVAEAVCASNNTIIKARLLSSTMFMSGVTTVCMALFGLRLPLFQGASSVYVIPLLMMANTDGVFCSNLNEKTDKCVHTGSLVTTTMPFNATSGFMNATNISDNTDRIIDNIRMLQGSLIVAGIVHAFLGMTGMVGIIVKYVGPLTVVPTLILVFIFFVKPVLKFVEVCWPITFSAWRPNGRPRWWLIFCYTFSTIMVAVILFLYLDKYQMPVPVWTPKLGFRIIRYPLHQVFAILISMAFNWALCGILTVTGVFPDDKDSTMYNARTDARSEIIADNPWFMFPYPGQYGPISFNGGAFLAFMIATLMSVLDSIGDYYACAKVCRVPAPPKHAMNRGILIEGLCSMMSGAVGCGHATSTYGGNIGAIGVTRVASRDVFLAVGILYIFFGIFGKFSAVFITIPYPVLGGAIAVMFGIFFGVVISNLELINMSSPRNIAILGLSIFIGLSVPTWAQKVKTPVQTGNDSFDRIIAMLLGNPNLMGTIIAFFLDNTVPGSDEDRGIAAWHVSDEDEFKDVDHSVYDEGYEVYRPLLPQRFLYSSFMKYVPFLPYKKRAVEAATDEKIA